MPTTVYHNMNGMVIGASSGGVRLDFLTDALGSVTATVNQSAQVVNTYRWKPFGDLLAKTGGGSDPRMGFCGAWGYQRTNRLHAENYVRARHLDTRTGRWTTVDLLWPGESAYGYVRVNPTSRLDPSGNEEIQFHFNSFIHKDEDALGSTKVDCYGVRRDKWLPAPLNPSGLLYYRGDSRDFFEAGVGKTSRVRSQLIINSCNIGSLTWGDVVVNIHSDRTQGLVLRTEGWRQCFLYLNPFPTPYYTLHSIENLTDSGMRFSRLRYEYKANDPIVESSPNLHADLYVTLWAWPDDVVWIQVSEAHTAYPWHESWAYSKRSGNKRLYKYAAGVQNFLGLFYHKQFSSPVVNLKAETFCRSGNGVPR